MKKEEISSKIENLLEKYYQELEKSPESKEIRVPLSTLPYDSTEAISVIRTILNGWISEGPNVRNFEKSFAQKMGCQFGIAVNSGSSANLISLQALKNYYKLKNGDEVIVPAVTFATVSMPIIQVGLTPVYVDVDRETMNINPKDVEKSITPKTKIIMPVHTLGIPAQMDQIMEIAENNNLLVLEDCCEAHGSEINGKKVGSLGDISAFSFFVAHHMTTGEGGMILTSNSQLEKECRSLKEFGRCGQKSIAEERFYTDNILKDYDKRYVFMKIGYNMRMTDICAALGLVQLGKLEKMNEKRRENTRYLRLVLTEKFSEYFEFPGENCNYHYTLFAFPILLKEKADFSRREICEYLEENNIETRPLFAGCLPDQPAFRDQPGRAHGELIQSRYIRDRLFFIGIFPGLNKEHLDHVISNISNFVKKRKLL